MGRILAKLRSVWGAQRKPLGGRFFRVFSLTHLTKFFHGFTSAPKRWAGGSRLGAAVGVEILYSKDECSILKS